MGLSRRTVTTKIARGAVYSAGTFSQLRTTAHERAEKKLTDRAIALNHNEDRTPNKPRPTITSGPGTMITAGLIESLEHNPVVEGDNWYGRPGHIGIAQKMIRDSHVRTALSFVDEPIRSGIDDIKATGDRPVDIECAKFCKKYFLQKLNWDAFLEQVLFYPRDGFSMFEMTDDVHTINRQEFPLHQGGGFGIVPTGLFHIPAWTVVEFHARKDNERQLDFIKQRNLGVSSANFTERIISADRIVRFTQKQEGSDFQGNPQLRAAYGPWKIRIALLAIMAIKHERNGLGVPEIQLPEDPSDNDISTAKTILAEMRTNEKGFIITPHGYVFRWTGASDNDSTNVEGAIETMNRDIAIVFKAGFMRLGDANFGSFALASTQEGQLGISLEAHAAFITGVINFGVDGWSPLKRIAKLNYPDASVPRYEIRNLPIRAWDKILTNANALLLSGGLTYTLNLEQAMLEAMQLPFDRAAIIASRGLDEMGMPIESQESEEKEKPTEAPSKPEEESTEEESEKEAA